MANGRAARLPQSQGRSATPTMVTQLCAHLKPEQGSLALPEPPIASPPSQIAVASGQSTTGGSSWQPGLPCDCASEVDEVGVAYVIFTNLSGNVIA